MYLFGCGILALSTLACALAQTGIQLIMFRAISGLAISCCLPSTTSIVTSTFESGKARSIAFASLGAAQPTGFSLGLILGGILVDTGTAGWRYGFYMGFGTNVIMLIAAVFAIPTDTQRHEHSIWKSLVTQVDWIGNFLASTAMALISYVFA
jgi:MFS family permease